MAVKIGIIVVIIFFLVFIALVIWYVKKLRCLKYTGRTYGTIISSTEFKRSYTTPEKKTYYKIDVEYYVNDQKYKLHRSYSPLENSSLGSNCEVIYDENAPAKNVLAKEIEDPKLARDKWIVYPVLAAGILVIVFGAWLPILFDFNKKQYDIYENLIYLIVIIGSDISLFKSVAKKDKRTVKDHIACTVVILVSLLIAAFIFYLTFFIS